MSPLPIDDRRIAKLADACDLIDEERPRGPDWKARHNAAYFALARACDQAGINARVSQEASNVVDVKEIAGRLIELAERCEAATGPDRDIDALIAPFAGSRVVDEGYPLGRCCYDADHRLVTMPPYTRSLDAAMSLVPKGASWSLYDVIGKRESVRMYGRGFDVLCAAANPALALCAAALRARAHLLATEPTA